MKNHHMLRVPAFTENYGESRMRASKSCIHLVLLAQPFTHSPPTRIASVVDTKQSGSLKLFFFEMVIGDFSVGYFMI